MTTDMLPAVVTDEGHAIMERVLIQGDLGKLTPDERVRYYMETCKSLGLNPLTKPFDYLTLSGKLVLYANRSAADQLRNLRGVSVIDVDIQKVDEAYCVIVKGRDATGREDVDLGYVSTRGLGGEALGNAMKKAVTQGKRRLTLSLVGLGMMDETELEAVPAARREDVDPATGEILSRSDAVKARLRPAEPVIVSDDEPRIEFSRTEFLERQHAGEVSDDIVKAALAEHFEGRKFGTLDPIEVGELAIAVGLA